MSSVSPSAPLSVVVPVYGVEAYLGECLDSLLAQDVVGEVIVVNDASPDRSREIAECFEQADPRVKVIDNAVNLGLGASRNVGLGHASLPYVTFMDSDDLASPGGYAAMVASLETTGSDLATAPADEFAVDGTRKRYWTVASPLFERGARRVTVRDAPELIRDHTAWTKVVRREFLIEHGIRWAQGTLCEDVVASAALYCDAAAVDVVPIVSYLYRRRPGSITTDLRSDRPLGDWARQTARALGMVHALDSPMVEQELIDKILDFEVLSRTGRIRRLEPSRNRGAALETMALIAAGATVETWIRQRVDTVRAMTVLLRAEHQDIPKALLEADRELGIGLENEPHGSEPCRRDVSTDAAEPEPTAGPLVTCVMVTRDNAARCHDAVNSVLLQETVDLELIVVDDSSTDATWGHLERFARSDPRIRLLRSPGRGTANALNAGARLARGKYLAFMRGTDLLPQRALAAMASMLDGTGDSMLIADELAFDLKSTERRSGVPGVREPAAGWSGKGNPELLRNPPLWNRLVRRSWWERRGLGFTGGENGLGEAGQLVCLLVAEGISVFPEVGFIRRNGIGADDWGRAERFADLARLTVPPTPTATRQALLSADWPRPWGAIIEALEAGVTPSRAAVIDLRQFGTSPREALPWARALCLSLLAEGDPDGARAILALDKAEDGLPDTALEGLETLTVNEWKAADHLAARTGYRCVVLRRLMADQAAWSVEELARLQSLSRRLHSRIDLRQVPVWTDARVVEAILGGTPDQLRRELMGAHEPASGLLTASRARGVMIEVDADEESRRLLRVECDLASGGAGAPGTRSWWVGSSDGRSAPLGSRRNRDDIGSWNVTGVFRDRFGLLRLPLVLRAGKPLTRSTASTHQGRLVLRGRTAPEVALRSAVKRALRHVRST